MYENILIPHDGSKEGTKGADHGVDLAASIGATVHVVYVVKEGGNPWMSQSMDDQVEQAKEYGERINDEVVEKADARGVETVTATPVGASVHKKIHEYAEEEDIDLIVMGSGYYGKYGGLLGSTAEKVLRTAEVPITTVRLGDRE